LLLLMLLLLLLLLFMLLLLLMMMMMIQLIINSAATDDMDQFFVKKAQRKTAGNKGVDLGQIGRHLDGTNKQGQAQIRDQAPQVCLRETIVFSLGCGRGREWTDLPLKSDCPFVLVFPPQPSEKENTIFAVV